MFDYDQTIENFLTEVELYLTQRMEHAKDKAEASKIQNTRFQWGMIKADPRKYINKKYEYMNMLSPDGFMRGKDYSVYHAVTDVLTAILNLYIDDMYGWAHMSKHQTEFLDAYKRWKYKSSTSIFKDFIFPFRSAASFAVHVKDKTK